VNPINNIGEVINHAQAGKCAVIISVRDYPRVHQADFLSQFTPQIIQAVNNGDLSLFFDHSNEADSPRALETFSTKMKQIGFTNHDNLNWICGNHSLPNNIFKVRHHTFNYFEIKAYVDIISNLQAWELSSDFISSSYQQASREARLLSLNETPRPERIASILCLFKAGIYDSEALDQINPSVPYLSFGGFKNQKGTGASTPEKIRQWLQAKGMDDLLQYFEKIHDKRLTVDSFKERGNTLFNKIDSSFYRSSVMSYVTETSMEDNVMRYSEKSIKPLILGHPIVVSGTRGNIQLIRELGFSVLDHVIDHSYDSEPRSTSRIRSSAKAAKDFLAKVSDGNGRIVDQIIPHLRHNVSWGLNEYPLVLYKKCADLFRSIRSVSESG
jgi:hypothetical protein